MGHFFQFEQDFVDSLRCIPMQVRYRLDTCGIKLKLDQWNQFDLDDRTSLLELPCQTPTEIAQYRQHLISLIQQRTGQTASELPIDPQPEWENATAIPAIVQAKAQSLGLQLQIAQWQALQPMQRFALIKLSRSSHENANFLPALKEFKISV
jgi:hypothetical protein